MSASAAEQAKPAAGIATPQFALLVVINLFVGGMVGLERTVLPLIAESEFGIASKAAAIAFIATFGVSKALLNLFAGGLADRMGRRRVLIAGWIAGLPVPFIIMLAGSWQVILLANILLGINQALTWSMTLVMKVDIAGTRRRGAAIGFNEFAGYAGVAGVAFLTGVIATRTHLRPEPFFLGIAVACAGTALAFFTRESRIESGGTAERAQGPSFRELFGRVSLKDRILSSACLAGFSMNLKDGALWGLLPILLKAQGVPIEDIGIVAGIYPAVWSAGQLLFGPLSDTLGRRAFIVAGLATQGLGLLALTLFGSLAGFASAAAVIGLGTAMAYPVALALVSDASPERWRASALGVYRFWRDLGYVAGALAVGLLADAAGLQWAMIAAAALLFTSSGVVARNARPA